MPAPYGAFQVSWRAGTTTDFYVWNEWDQYQGQPSSCQTETHALVGPVVRVASQPGSLRCFEEYADPRYSYAKASYYGYLGMEQLTAPSPIEDFDFENPPSYAKNIVTWPERPPSRTELEVRTRAALESGEYRFIEPWYAHQLDPQTYEDPTEDEQQRDDCRPADSVPAGDPAPLRGTQDFLQDPDQWRARYEAVPAGEFPVGSTVPEDGLVASEGPAYMRWGWTSLNAKEHIDWQGWGYRKIVAKHGWGPTALEKTSEALLTTPVRELNYDQYIGPPYTTRSGRVAGCQWVVSVQRDPIEEPERPELSQAVPMGGIITAHGRYVAQG
jgi:hypothetical protein